MAKAWVKVEGKVRDVANLANFTRSSLINASRAIKSEMLARQSIAFALGGHAHHGGKQWRPLSPATVAIKSKSNVPFPAAPLIRTGDMSQSQRVSVDLGILPDGSVKYIIKVWNTKSYSGHHQSGYPNWGWNGVFKGRWVPAREPVQITGDDLQWVASLLRQYMRVDGSENKPAKEQKYTKAARMSGVFGAGGAVRGIFGENSILARFRRGSR